ncbi:MAG: glucosamine kinase [Planctomycetota bacterium]|jgi:glucosamine kinase
MILVADSGSTKCDWLVLNNDWQVVDHIKTIGLNPYFHNELFISNTLARSKPINEINNSVIKVFFYGAGCSNGHFNKIMENGLLNIFPNAKIKVDHDLMACALAAYDNEPSICCILGTGSNSCFFDGENLKRGKLSLGYILGDEASGSFFGKKLLNDYFYNNLPKKLNDEFEMQYNLSHLEFTKNVYGAKNANVFLASFMKFISVRKENIYLQEMIKDGFRLFFKNHVCCFPNYKQVKTNFIGSIGFYFQEEIIEVAKEFDIKVGQFIQRPIFNLVEVHKAKEALKVKR